MNEQIKTNNFKNWFKNLNKNLVVFIGTFLLNNLIIWLMFILYWFFTYEIAFMVVCTIIVPLIGGILRGLFSTYTTKKFWLITSIWAIILAIGYVPLFAWVSMSSFSDYGFDVIIGLVVAGIMMISSFIGFIIRKKMKAN